MILIIKNCTAEGPGIITVVLDRNNQTYKIIDLEKKDTLPENVNKYKGYIILGGTMNVYEQEKYPFLKAEELMIKKIIESDLPLLGICLGAQMLTKSVGDTVDLDSCKEVGWTEIELTETGANDKIFSGIERSFNVFQWHSDTFHIPKNGTRLATGSKCKNQAFKIKTNIYAFQFHIEVTADIVKNWLGSYTTEKNDKLAINPDEVFSDTEKYIDKSVETGIKIIENFIKLW